MTAEPVGSDEQVGADWWQASDLRWYPPHLHPGRVAAQRHQGNGTGLVVGIVAAVVLAMVLIVWVLSLLGSIVVGGR